MSFLVKIPIYIYHDWLLKANVETPFFKIRFNYLNKILIIDY